MRKVIVKISRTGVIQSDLSGFENGSCSEVAESMAAMFGSAEEVTKDDFEIDQLNRA